MSFKVAIGFSRGKIEVVYRGGDPKAYSDALRRLPEASANRAYTEFKFPKDVELAEMIGDALRKVSASAVSQDGVREWFAEEKRRRDDLVAIKASEEVALLYEKTEDLWHDQKIGVAFMARAKFCLMNDTMGFGKTVEAIAALREIELQDGLDGDARYLIVVPNSAKESWARHVDRWHPDPGEIELVGKGKNLVAGATKPGFYIINWDIIANRLDLLTAVAWDGIVADESHRMKNRDAQRTKAMLALLAKAKPEARFLMTGTPVRNHVPDLWTQLHGLDPERFPSFWSFVGRYLEMEDVSHGRGKHKEFRGYKDGGEADLNRTLRGLRIGRDNAKDLPPVLHTETWVELGPKQRKAYEQMRDEFVAWVSDSEPEVVAANWLSQALRLKQIAGTLAALSDVEDESAKLDSLMEKVKDFQEQEEPVVIMSQFTSILWPLRDRLEKAKIAYVEMTGPHKRAWHPHLGYTNLKTGGNVEYAFQETYKSGPDKIDVLIATIQTGGEAITLTRARLFEFLDLTWVPGEVDQAWKRVHRGGQTRNVIVDKILAKGTVDELTILPTLRTKQEIIDSISGSA